MILAEVLEENGMKPVEIKGVRIGEGMPKICVPIVARTEVETLEQAKQILQSKTDIVEWRVDWYEKGSDKECVKALLSQLRKEMENTPILFTFRTKAEGGESEIAFEKYAELLRSVADTRMADIIDVEVFQKGDIPSLIKDIQREDVKVLCSNHDFEKTPKKKEVMERLEYMQELGADIAKIAVMPRCEEDVQILLDATRETAQHAKGPIVTMSMGEMGVRSRVEGESFGSAMTFGSAGKSSAPGQVPACELRSMLEKIHCQVKA